MNSPTKPNIIFFGTAEFAAFILQDVIERNTVEILEVVTQPDKPVGKKRELLPSPVKQIALENRLKIQQPIDAKSEKFIEHVRKLQPDVLIVAAYGQIISQELLDIPKHGAINVHGSLLPSYRGASPIQSAIAAGESETGVTIMLMDAKMDHGPILKIAKTAIGNDETAQELHDRLAHLGGKTLLEVIPEYIDGSLKPIEQDHDKATYTKLLKREDGKLDYKIKTAQELYDQYRGYYPWPGSWFEYNSKRIKVLKAAFSKNEYGKTDLQLADDKLFLQTSEGSLELIEVQPEGKKPMSGIDFYNGYVK